MMRRGRPTKPALAAAVDLLAARGHGAEELRRKLRGKGYDEADIDAAVAKLTARRYLDDAALCAQLFAQYLAAEKYGLQAIRYKLMEKGFDSRLIDAAAAGRHDAYELAAARKQAAKKTEGGADREKIGRFLAGRGFSYAVIERVLSETVE